MERAFAELILQLHEKLEISVVSSTLGAELKALVNWHRVWIPRRPFPLKFTVFFARAGNALRRHPANVVCTLGAIVPNRTDLAAIHFCHAGRLSGVESLGYPDTPLLNRLNTATARLLALWAERWCYRPDRVSTFAAVSNGVASELATYYAGIPIRVVPNGVDGQRFRPSATTRADLRKELSTDPNAVVALFVGGDWDRKGLAMAIGAVAATRSLGQPISLWVLGRGDKSRFQELASTLGVADSVTFFGVRSDTERFYQAADVFVLPSVYETFSLVCFEAAACALPLVIPRISGASELVGEDEAGLIVDRDSQLIGEALVKLASDESLRQRLGATARARAVQFTWEATAEAFLDVVVSLLPPGRG